MPKSDAYVIGYAAVVCLASSLLLAVATVGLKKQQDKMVELDRKFNVLKAFQAPVVDAKGVRAPAAEVEALFAKHVRSLVLDPATGLPIEGRAASDYTDREIEARAVLPLYEWIEGDRATKYALPTSGKGLWSTIYGYLAVDGAASKIVGLSFYRHGETPGLGGEVEKDWFVKNFEGATIFADGAPRRVVVAKGKVGGRRSAGAEEQVDGISGATLTGKGVMQFLNRDIERYGAYFERLRKD